MCISSKELFGLFNFLNLKNIGSTLNIRMNLFIDLLSGSNYGAWRGNMMIGIQAAYESNDTQTRTN